MNALHYLQRASASAAASPHASAPASGYIGRGDRVRSGRGMGQRASQGACLTCAERSRHTFREPTGHCSAPKPPAATPRLPTRRRSAHSSRSAALRGDDLPCHRPPHGLVMPWARGLVRWGRRGPEAALGAAQTFSRFPSGDASFSNFLAKKATESARGRCIMTQIWRRPTLNHPFAETFATFSEKCLEMSYAFSKYGQKHPCTGLENVCLSYALFFCHTLVIRAYDNKHFGYIW